MMKPLLLLAGFCAILWGGFSLTAQTNTNRIAGVSSYYNTNTNAVVIVLGGVYATTTNNQNGEYWVLMSGSSSNRPHWTYLSLTNIPGSLSGSQIHGSIQSGITTNINVILPGPVTNSLRFTNGVLRAVGASI